MVLVVVLLLVVVMLVVEIRGGGKGQLRLLGCFRRRFVGGSRERMRESCHLTERGRRRRKRSGRRHVVTRSK